MNQQQQSQIKQNDLQPHNYQAYNQSYMLPPPQYMPIPAPHMIPPPPPPPVPANAYYVDWTTAPPQHLYNYYPPIPPPPYDYMNHHAGIPASSLYEQNHVEQQQQQQQPSFLHIDPSYTLYQQAFSYHQACMQAALVYQQQYQQQQQQQQQQSQIRLSQTISDFNQFESIQPVDGKSARNDRQTPLLYQRPHRRAIFSGFNCLLIIKPNEPCEGQPAVVEIHQFNDLIEANTSTDKDYQQIHEFPGPLQMQQTPKAAIIQYCQRKIKECLSQSSLIIDSQSNLLLWEYLVLLVRQNGRVDLRTDIPALLLNDEQSSNWSLNNQKSSLIDDSNELNDDLNGLTIRKASLSENEMLAKLRDFLLSGQIMDAIEFSIKHNLWSHAFYLSIQYSSLNNEKKLIEKTKLRFLNSLQPNDPLQTCYQLLNGSVPSINSNQISSKSIEWNDWRRHLAMIVSNVSEKNRGLCIQSIKSLADCLSSNGRIAAAHFCYLLANVEFGDYNNKSSKVVLIGSSHHQPFGKFCELTAIQATEIYEYATQTTIESFLFYKLFYAMKLCDYGLLNEAYKYTELISKYVNLKPTHFHKEIKLAYYLASRLRTQDVDFQLSNSLNDDGSTAAGNWYKELEENFKKLSNISSSVAAKERCKETPQKQIGFVRYVKPPATSDNCVNNNNNNVILNNQNVKIEPIEMASESQVVSKLTQIQQTLASPPPSSIHQQPIVVAASSSVMTSNDGYYSKQATFSDTAITSNSAVSSCTSLLNTTTTIQQPKNEPRRDSYNRGIANNKTLINPESSKVNDLIKPTNNDTDYDYESSVFEEDEDEDETEANYDEEGNYYASHHQTYMREESLSDETTNSHQHTSESSSEQQSSPTSNSSSPTTTAYNQNPTATTHASGYYMSLNDV